MDAGKDNQMIYKKIQQYILLLKARNIHILQAHMFGSYVKGTADEWSDIDLALVTDSFVGDAFDFRFC
nr:nucleotidyltransferase domain-containing protein [Desulfobacula sp.]